MAGIYIHIPYCRKLCSYCDFYHVMSTGDSGECLEAMAIEMDLRKDYLHGENISTIYIGGGTPSLLTVRETEGLLNSIMRLFHVESDCEITVEMNPDDIEAQYLSEIRQLGINRLSIGIQSWRDANLKLLNRRHDSAKASRALKDAISAGFENVTIDLIYGIPGMTRKEWAENLDYSFSFDIKHLSAYHLTFEKGTMLWKMREKQAINEIDEDESAALFNILIEKAENAGFIHYEISNFGKPGYFSRHNSNYWKQVNYLGIGPSAHSFNGYSRQWNVSSVKEYIKSVNSGRTFYEREELDTRSRFNEYIMTSLRTMWGIDLEYVEKAFDKESYDYLVNLSGKFKNYGLMKSEGHFLILTNQGKMISDNIISEFMMPE